jgi:GNAT superfamily N-acetyltransferase
MVIRPCGEEDLDRIVEIVNDAAEAYRGVIPSEGWHEPYLSRRSLAAEIDAGVAFSGWYGDAGLVGVMGLQPVKDVQLIRHAYVRREWQGRGIGRELMVALAANAHGRLLVGTWAAAGWAIRFYERNGFELVSTVEKNRLLDTYWTIPPSQREASVVLVRRRDAPMTA